MTNISDRGTQSAAVTLMHEAAERAKLPMSLNDVNIEKLLDDVAPGVNVIPREQLRALSFLSYDIKNSLSGIKPGKLNLLLYPELEMDYVPLEEADEIAQKATSISAEDTLVLYAVPTIEKDGYKLVRGYVLDLETGKVESYRKNSETSWERLNNSGRRPVIDENPILIETPANDIEFRVCMDIMTNPVKSGLGVVSANMLDMDDLMLAIKNAKSPFVVLDKMNFGLYLIEPDIPKITYERIA